MLLMLSQWLQGLSPEFGFFRVFQYLTFRAVMAAMTALLIGLVAGPKVIRVLTSLKIGQPIRGYAMQSHLSKSGTPTMGGVLILLSIAISTLLWFDLSNRFVWIVLVVTLGFGAIGWADDWRKVVNKDPNGMRSREKYMWQSLIGLLAALCTAWLGRGRGAQSWVRCILAALMPVVFNFVLVGAVLTWSLTDAVFPHLNASFWVFGGQVALGEIAVLGVLGLPLMRLLPRNPKFREIIRSYQKE